MSRRDRTLPLSLRLVLTYVLITASVLLVVSGLLYHLTRRHLRADLEGGLAAAVASFAEGPARTVSGPADLERAARTWLAVRGFATGEIAMVRTVEGRALSAAGGVDPEALPIEVVDARASRWSDLEVGGRRLRLLSVPLVLEGSQQGTLVVGASMDGVDRTLRAMLVGAGVAGGLGILLAAALGLLAVRRTLRPLLRISSRAEAIEATGDLSVRVGGEGPPDEVGRLAETFDRMLDRVEDSFRAQQRFVSDASHELRTPITVLRGQLELLQEELGRARRDSVGPALEEVERMQRIVDDLLLLARLDEGLPLEREPVEVELVMQEALVRGLAGERRSTHVDVDTGLHAWGDAERLLQALTNLVANAVRHAGDDAAIRLAARVRGDRVEIDVADTGRGIPPDELPHVFSRLFRGARSRSTPGAGLGLAISSSLVEAMGGEIRADSAPGRGTTFTVSLPAAAAPIRGAPVREG